MDIFILAEPIKCKTLKRLTRLLLYFIFISLNIFWSEKSVSQNTELYTRELRVKKATGKIELDGILNEADWKTADTATNFWQYFPSDSVISSTISEAKITFDNQFLYVGFKVIDPNAGPWVTTSLRRDFRGDHNDVISVIFDTFSDKTNGILFGINPFGVQREGMLSGISGSSGARSGFDLSWDNKWFSATKTYTDYWTAELAIPFKTLRYKGGATSWRANFYRIDSKTAERSTWNHIPRNQLIYSVAFTGDILFDEPLPKPGANVTLIPYASGLVAKDFLNGTESKFNGDFGGDIKIGVTPSLNLDLTFNPDFSQVEADEQQSNLTRFELYYPEKRQFFLENQDVFASFGASRLRPFFSRRLGIAFDPETKLYVQNKIQYGARLSGRIDKNWRIGLMNMQSARDFSIRHPETNYTVLAIQRQLFTRSNISVIGINKQVTNNQKNDEITSQDSLSNDYNRLIGVDYNLASADNRWSGKLFYHRSITSENKSNVYSHGVNVVYNIPWINLEWNHQLVGENFNPEIGFAPRTGYNLLSPGLQFLFYSGNKFANHGPGLSTEYIWNEEFGKTDHELFLYYTIDFSSSAKFEGGIRNNYTYLLRDFNPINSEDMPLSEGTDYNYTSLVAEYRSDRRKDLYYELGTQIGQFYNGHIYSLSGELNLRYGLLGVASLNFSYNNVSLPEPHSTGTVLLVGPKLDFTFSKKVFLTTFLQYNNQIDNININARFQYRYKPVSDFYLVYTENYFPEGFGSKNRAIVAKLTYWLNL